MYSNLFKIKSIVYVKTWEIKMKVIGFIASPRKAGNTAWAVNQILDGAREQGAETESWCSGGLNIKPCQGCLSCVESGKCAVNDDMQEIYSALSQSDALVLGLPIYMGQMSGQGKVFNDRLFAQIKPRFSPAFKEENAGKKLILVFTQGNPNPEIFKEYIDYTERMFNLLEFDVKGVQIVAGTRNGPASEQDGLPVVLKKLGTSLIPN
jgi:multimeric flavodoxin WrbA